MKKYKYSNLFILIFLLILNVISLFNMINAKLISSVYDNAFLKQLIWFLLGYFLIFIFSKIKIKKIFKYSKLLFILSVISLIIVLFFGSEINGAKCWINFWGISFQPSELVKITLTFFLIATIEKAKITNIKDEFVLISKLFLITVIPSILVFLEPDTGAIINYFIILIIILFYAKLNKWWYISLISLFLLFTISIFIMFFFFQDMLINIIGTSVFYRMDRIINFANGNSYQLENALITIGSSTFWGIGINKILLYIPEAPTDFFFAFSTGNYGIISSIIIIISYLIIDLNLLTKIDKQKNKNFKRFISCYLGIFLFHQIYNIFMNIGLLPIMGIPLPFLSYGGTNTIINFLFLAFILNFKNKQN